MHYELSRQGEVYISISNKQYKIVKFINGDGESKAQKVFQIELKNPEQLLHLKTQLQNVKDYLVRLHQLPSALQLQSSELEIMQKENQTHFVVKVNSPFCQYPTLFDFYKKQIVNPSYKINYDQKFYIYFFEEFFELMIKGGGIKDFFYTNHNIWIMPPQSSVILEYGKLSVNKTSIVGLKFIKGYESITKEQFIEIYPSLPPNVFEMMQDKSAKGRAKLELIIKIRSFSFLILTFVLKRVPPLFEQNFKPRIDCESPQIKNLIQKIAEKMRKFLQLPPIQKEIKIAQKLTKVKLSKFFQTVFVQTKEQDKLDWLFVYKIFFQKNIVNLESYQRSYQCQILKKENQFYLQNQVYFQKIINQMWEMQPQKNFYIERGFVRANLFKVNMVYFLVKTNGNFHRLLRYLNIAQWARMHRFTEDTHQIVIRLMDIFVHKLQPRDQQNHKLQPRDQQKPNDIYRIIQQSRAQSRRYYKTDQPTGNGLTFEQESDLNIFNPFAFKNEKEQELASQTQPNTTLHFPSSPVQFLQKMYSHHSLSAKPPARRGNQEGEVQITTMSHRLENIINISNSLWFV